MMMPRKPRIPDDEGGDIFQIGNLSNRHPNWTSINDLAKSRHQHYRSGRPSNPASPKLQENARIVRRNGQASARGATIGLSELPWRKARNLCSYLETNDGSRVVLNPGFQARKRSSRLLRALTRELVRIVFKPRRRRLMVPPKACQACISPSLWELDCDRASCELSEAESMTSTPQRFPAIV